MKLFRYFSLALFFLLIPVRSAQAASMTPDTPPRIELVQETVSHEAGTPFDGRSNIAGVTDGWGRPLRYSDTLKPGCYIIRTDNLYNAGKKQARVHAMDRAGLITTKAFPVDVYYYTEPGENDPADYMIRINRAANTVTVYGPDDSGEYTVPCRVMVCSTGGLRTPLGTFRTSDRYNWRYLISGVFGQYATRIVGKILFHSVPYYRMDPSMLETEEFNRLGSDGSLGCIRLRVCDCKWIYDHIPAGTQVEIYDDASDPGPLGKPVCIRLDPEDELSGWDPTDPALPAASGSKDQE